MAESSISVRDDTASAVITIAATGCWTWRLRVGLMAAVRKVLAEQPRGVLLDLSGMVGADSAVIAIVLFAEAQAAAMHPPVPLIIAAGESQRLRLHRGGVAQRI